MNSRFFGLLVLLAFAWVPNASRSQELPYVWDGRQFPTLEAAEVAMRAHPANAPIGSDLVLCGDDIGVPASGELTYRYCAKPRPVIPTGAGGFWMMMFGFQSTSPRF